MNVTTLAQAMNVTEKDVLSLLNMVITSLKQDGMKEIFLDMDEKERTNTIQAYVSAEVKKFKEFCFSLLTNTEKKSAFDQYLFHKLQEV
jgi:hypothetical protein